MDYVLHTNRKRQGYVSRHCWTQLIELAAHGEEPAAVAHDRSGDGLALLDERLVADERAFADRLADAYSIDDVMPRMARLVAEGTGAAAVTGAAAHRRAVCLVHCEPSQYRSVWGIPDGSTYQPAGACGPTGEGAESASGLSPSCSRCIVDAAVGCAIVAYTRKNGTGKVELLQIEGDPDSPISRGRLCPKGAASENLINSPIREYKVKYRRPYGTEWEELDLDTAVDMVADRIIETRAATWEDRDEEGSLLNRTLGVVSFGGATLDNEENYLIKKLSVALGIVGVENQARI